VLILLGLGLSLYLGHLYLSVHNPGHGPVESFCALSESFNCVTVATSEYSSFLGLPIALYGIEFFAASLAVLMLSTLGIWRVRRWDSLVFVAAGLGLPVCGLLAWISTSRIHSFCIMCGGVYGATLLLFVSIGLASKLKLRALLFRGPLEVLGLMKTAGGGTAVTLALVLGVSQFFWVPRLLNSEPGMLKHHYRGQITRGLTMGPPDAPIQIEEFTDFQCPYCGRAHQTLMAVMKRFSGKIRLRHRDYPLDNACNPKIPNAFHPQACMAATYARCAAWQNKYWPYEEVLFTNRAFLAESDLKQFARQLKLDMTRLEACVKGGRARQAIQQDIQEGIKRELKGTPTFFVNGEVIVGLRPQEFWEKKITALLEK